MAKKCIPGVLCVENMTLFIVFLLLLFSLFFFFTVNRDPSLQTHLSFPKFYSTQTTIENSGQSMMFPSSLSLGLAKPDIFNDPYYPPLKDNIGSGVYYPRNFTDVRGLPYVVPSVVSSSVYGVSNTPVVNNIPLVSNIPLVRNTLVAPINIETQRTGGSYGQVGILTRQLSSTPDMILPLFGRNLFSNRNKWQYYTVSNTGQISSKLPVRVNGKDGMSEYGVDELMCGDTVYVEGYKDTFLATIYDSRGISYLPY